MKLIQLVTLSLYAPLKVQFPQASFADKFWDDIMKTDRMQGNTLIMHTNTHDS